MCCSRSCFLVILELFLGDFFECFRDLSLGDFVEDVCINPLWLFSL
jgi:hypothetical protein